MYYYALNIQAWTYNVYYVLFCIYYIHLERPNFMTQASHMCWTNSALMNN